MSLEVEQAPQVRGLVSGVLRRVILMAEVRRDRFRRASQRADVQLKSQLGAKYQLLHQLMRAHEFDHDPGLEALRRQAADRDGHSGQRHVLVHRIQQRHDNFG